MIDNGTNASCGINAASHPLVDDDDVEAKLVALAKYKEAQLKATGPREARPTGISDAEADAFACEHTYSPEIIDNDSRRELVPVADLPNGHGWGAEVQQLLSGGLGPGDVITLGAGRAGAGKTAFLLQLSDGLAMRCAELAMRDDLDPAQPLTPVLIMSELDHKDIAKRTVARLGHFPVNVLRSQPAAIRLYGRIFRDENEARRLVEAAYQQARAITSDGGWFQAMRPWQHVARPEASLATLDVMKEHLERWRDKIAKAHPKRNIQPVLVIDPVQRWQPEGMSEVEALNILSERIDKLADRHGWSVVMTSDTNKEQAKAGAEDAISSAAAFRGSYKLVHSSETTMVLRPDDPAPPKNAPKGFRFRRAAIEPWEERPRAITLTIDKNRNGPSWGEASFMWRPACGLFTPEVPEETEERRRTDQESARSQAANYGDFGGSPRTNAKAANADDDAPKRDAILKVLEDVAVSASRGGREPVPQSGNSIISVVRGKRDAIQRELRLLESEGIISSVKHGGRLIGYVFRPFDGTRSAGV